MWTYKYLRYVLLYKWFVLVAGHKLRACPIRLLLHDCSKFRPSEFIPYKNYFFGGLQEDKFRVAWLAHMHRNPHHWEYWVLVGEPLEMPSKYVKEMVCGWAGRGRLINNRWGVLEWYETNKSKILLHKNTRVEVEALVHRLEALMPKH